MFGLPCLNQYDFATNDLGDCFTTEPDFAPYDAVPVDERIFDPAKAMTPLDEDFDWKAAAESPELDDPEEIKKERRDDERLRVNH